jgi:hypothetical protein
LQPGLEETSAADPIQYPNALAIWNHALEAFGDET